MWNGGEVQLNYYTTANFLNSNPQYCALNNVHRKRHQVITEDLLSAAIRHRIAQAYNPDLLPKVPPTFHWKFYPDNQCYYLHPPAGRPIVSLGTEWIISCPARALQNLVAAHIERYYNH